METVKKSDVHNSLIKLEKEFFGYDNENNPNITAITRIQALFTELYLRDSHPKGVGILIRSWQLVKHKGRYYHVVDTAEPNLTPEDQERAADQPDPKIELDAQESKLLVGILENLALRSDDGTVLQLKLFQLYAKLKNFYNNELSN